jgi:predicted nucleotide-binding protein (sugar kinase/HSP70/actin superfamily)
MRVIAVPNFGNYSIAFAAAAESLGIPSWIQITTTPETVRLGTEAAPETTCLPFKVFLGHFIKAAREGVSYGVMVNSIGTCRLKYYRLLQQQIIDQMGLNMRIFGLGYDGIKPEIIRYFNPSFFTFAKGVLHALLKMKVIDLLELLSWRTRAREINRGDTTRLMKQCLKELHASKTIRETGRLKKSVASLFKKIPVDRRKVPLKVCLVGEATMLRDPYLNHNIEELLGGLGVEVFNTFLLGHVLRKVFSLDSFNKYSTRYMMKLARPYMKVPLGGHALDSVANTIRSARDGYDGIIHICPAGCMAEISVRPILRKICKDYSLPLLEFSLDEHTSHVGLVTRLEAFMDILIDKKRKGN